MLAGYSGRPLVQKLGLKAGGRLLLVAAPTDFADALQPWPDGLGMETLGEVEALTAASPAWGGGDGSVPTRFNHIVAFFTVRDRLLQALPRLKACLAFDGGLWIAWPKRASGWATDVTEDAVRAIALDGGLVDNKVCAIDGVWSGLRLVYRLADRPKRG